MIFNKKEKNEAVIQEEDSSLNDWLEVDEVEAEGQLAIDVFHDDKKSPVILDASRHKVYPR